MRFFLFFALLCCGLFSCRKDTTTTGAPALRFSTDTLTFDTVFTETGSFTLSLKIFNPSSSAITLSSVRMGGGAASPFRINVDGIPGPEVTNVEIAGEDSVFVFATVRINPDTVDAPFIVEDSLLATVNGKQFRLPFMAYGQNAHYIRGELLETQTWGAADKKPYVVISSALVNPGATLTIMSGTRVYMHADSRLIVQGKLLAEGTMKDSIIFQGDRLDRAYFGYRGFPGEWGGLYFDSRSNGSRLRHVILQNGGNTALGALPALIQVNVDSVQNGMLAALYGQGGDSEQHWLRPFELWRKCGGEQCADLSAAGPTRWLCCKAANTLSATARFTCREPMRCAMWISRRWWRSIILSMRRASFWTAT